jgi:signal transduction histidine kinase
MRRRLVLAIAGVAAAAVVLFAVPLGLVLQRSYRNEDLLRLQRDTIAATRGIDLAPQGADPVELPRSRDALAVYDRTGRRVAGRGPATAPALVRTVLRSGKPAEHAGSGELVAAVPLLVNERVTGAVRASRSDAGATRDARGAWLVLAALAAAIIAGATVAALLLGRRLAGPLERVAGAARRLGEGDFSVRAPRAHVPEVDAVAGALDTTAERLGELVARERAFTTNASHQLRTPLAALRLELEALELRHAGDEEVDRALAQVDRLQGTIDTLLAVARDARQRDEVADLAVALGDVETRWHGVLAAEARPLRTRVAAGRAQAHASRQVVDEILDVLIDNARRHGRGAVTLTLRELDGWVALDVADEGPGFAVEAQGVLRSEVVDGHGIGLGLARTLADAAGGRLVVTEAGPSPVLTLVLRARRA